MASCDCVQELFSFDFAGYNSFKDNSESWCKKTIVEVSLFVGQFIIASPLS